MASGSVIHSELGFRLPQSVLLLFAFSVPAENSLILPAVGSISRVVGAFLLVIVALDVLVRQRVRALHPAFVPVVFFCGWAVASVVWSLDPMGSAIRALTYVQLTMMVWIVWEYTRTSSDVDRLLQAYVLGSLVTAIATIREFKGLGIAALASSDLRISAFGANPNEQGLTMVAALPLALFLLRVGKSQAFRISNLCYLLVGTFAIVLTASRTAAIAMLVAFAGMLWMLKDASRSARIGMLVAIVALVVVSISLIPDVTWNRITTLFAMLQQADFNQRQQVWQYGFDFWQRHPLQGAGAAAFISISERTNAISLSSHNTYLGLLVETGLIGATLLIASFVWILLESRLVGVERRRALLASMFAMFLGMVVTGWDHRKVPWLLLAVFLCASASRQRTSGAEMLTVDNKGSGY